MRILAIRKARKPLKSAMHIPSSDRSNLKEGTDKRSPKTSPNERFFFYTSARILAYIMRQSLSLHCGNYDDFAGKQQKQIILSLISSYILLPCSFNHLDGRIIWKAQGVPQSQKKRSPSYATWKGWRTQQIY